MFLFTLLDLIFIFYNQFGKLIFFFRYREMVKIVIKYMNYNVCYLKFSDIICRILINLSEWLNSYFYFHLITGIFHTQNIFDSFKFVIIILWHTPPPPCMDQNPSLGNTAKELNTFKTVNPEMVASEFVYIIETKIVKLKIYLCAHAEN